MLLIIGIGIVVYWFVKRQQKKKLKKSLQNTNRKATTEHLRTKGFGKGGEVKAYYSELTDIAELY
jgi:preprotein translocase subunit YajC